MLVSTYIHGGVRDKSVRRRRTLTPPAAPLSLFQSKKERGQRYVVSTKVRELEIRRGHLRDETGVGYVREVDGIQLPIRAREGAGEREREREGAREGEGIRC